MFATLEGRPLPIFPCYANKRPACANGFKDANDEPARIAALWGGRTGLLVAVPTGEVSGIAVLDIDAAGRNWLAENEHRLPPTRGHQTRSDGLHIVFRHRPGLRCSQGVIAPGVDVRAEGGYVIWWPVLGYGVEDRALAEWPDWLVPQDGDRRPKTGAFVPVQMRDDAPGMGRQRTDNLVRRSERILRCVEAAPVGTRNARLFWAARRFAEMIAEGAIRPWVAGQLLEEAARQCGLVRDDGIGAVRATIHSGLGR